jgi:NifU-like protein
MPIYPDAINKSLREAKHAGRLGRADAAGTAASFECGSFVRFEVAEIEGKMGIAYSTNGCGFLVAAAEVIVEQLEGRPLSELHGLRDEELAAIIESRVNQKFPDNRQQCLNLVLEGVHGVFANLRESRLASASSEALICTCFGVTEETIEKCIAVHQPKTIEEVTELCRAGGGCGSCRMLIGEMLDGTHML